MRTRWLNGLHYLPETIDMEPIKISCLWTSFALLVVLLAATSSEAAKTTDPFYVIAHMANSQASLDWAVKEGANAIELDLQFDGDGNPTVFEHGGLCDCSCPHPSSYHICSGVLKNKCSGGDASNNARQHLKHLAQLPGVALIYVDSKVEAKWGSRIQTAGKNLVDMLDKNLFANGYRGKVLIAVGGIDCYDFNYAAAVAATETSHASRYYFTFDDEKNNYNDVAAMLSKFTRNRIFSTGVTSCWIGDYTSGLTQAINGVRSGQIGMSIIWTLDKESSLERHIDLGVQGILTNRPGLLKSIALSKGIRLATPDDVIPVSTPHIESPNKCDCDYHKGGCTISFPAPINKACKCKYTFLWRCGGTVTDCSNASHEKCSNPDASLLSCQLGGGDCGGY